jgi:hypothetical protein
VSRRGWGKEAQRSLGSCARANHQGRDSGHGLQDAIIDASPRLIAKLNFFPVTMNMRLTEKDQSSNNLATYVESAAGDRARPRIDIVVCRAVHDAPALPLVTYSP